MEVIRSQTKLCPFCAETIQVQAIKCRFCGEFLNTDRAKAIEAGSQPNAYSSEDEETDDNLLFEGSPSLWAMAGATIKGLFVFVVAWLLAAYPLENLLWFELSENQALTIGNYRLTVAIGLAVLVLLILLLKMLRLKMTYYEVSADRIEYSRGIFDRQVDNLDMFRVIDLKLRRSLLDCILGIGTVSLITTDKTDPQFTFEKMRGPRSLYDIIKKASLDADQQRGVIHLE